jgi:hypothetical protein
LYSGTNLIKLEISNKKITEKPPNIWKLMLLNNPWVKKEMLREFGKYCKQMIVET